MENKKHQGQVVRQAIKDSGFKIVFIAKSLRIGRNKIYEQFEKETLSPYFLYRLGCIIHHDFVDDFPELEHNAVYEEAKKDAKKFVSLADKELGKLHVKYYTLLEDYTKLLKFLVRIANEYSLIPLKEKIELFLNKKRK